MQMCVLRRGTLERERTARDGNKGQWETEIEQVEIKG